MKLIYTILFLSLLDISYAINYENFKFSGETNYKESVYKTLNSKINIQYSFDLYKPSHQKYIIYLGGTLTNDYDHFGNVIKVNGFTTIGIDF
jgi:hypothetical protein